MTTTLPPSIRQALFDNAPNLPWQRSSLAFDKFYVKDQGMANMVTVTGGGGSIVVDYYESIIADDELVTRLLTCARARVEQDDLAEIERLAHSSRAGSEDIESDPKNLGTRIRDAVEHDIAEKVWSGMYGSEIDPLLAMARNQDVDDETIIKWMNS